jgi:hypothetical protein
MSSINISIHHSLSKDEVVAKTKSMLTNLQTKFAGMIDSVNEEWNGYKGTFTLSAKGFHISGNVVINDSTVDIEAAIPTALAFFKGAIESNIKKAVEESLK